MKNNYHPLLVAFNSTELALKALLSAPFDEGNGICLFCLDDECYYTVTLMEKFRADEYTPVSHLTVLVQPESSLEAGTYHNEEVGLIKFCCRYAKDIPRVESIISNFVHENANCKLAIKACDNE